MYAIIENILMKVLQIFLYQTFLAQPVQRRNRRYLFPAQNEDYLNHDLCQRIDL
jgi:hypothetical protein